MTTTPPLALVTGASSGIGLELATVFAERGYDVVMAAEDAEIETAADTVRRPGIEVRAVQADLRTPEGVEQVYSAATQDERPLDAVALNAGVGRGGTSPRPTSTTNSISSRSMCARRCTWPS